MSRCRLYLSTLRLPDSSCPAFGGATLREDVRHQSSAEFSSAPYFSAFQLPNWHFGLHLFDDVRHQAEIVLHQAVAGGQIALGPLLQALPLLLPGQGTGKGAGITGQMQGQKQAVGDRKSVV